MNASSGQKARRPLVWWGVGLMVAAVIGGVVGVVGAVTQAAGGVIDAFTADEYTTPMNAQFDFEEGDYLIYEFTGKTQSAGSNVGDNSRGLTVTPDAVTVTSSSGAQIPVKNQWLAESVTRGASEYTGAARFEITQAGTYTVNVQTPNTRVLVAPSIVSGFGDALIWVALVIYSADALRRARRAPRRVIVDDVDVER